jgi:hypothetical protein
VISTPIPTPSIEQIGTDMIHGGNTGKPVVAVPTMNPDQPYLLYSDTDFSIEYPSNWTVSSTTTTYDGTNLAPFETFVAGTRQVTFSDGNSTSFVALTTDKVNARQTTSWYPDFNKVADLLTLHYDDVQGAKLIRNYQTFKTEVYRTPYIRFDVILPDYSKYYPLEYTEQDMISFSHFYTFQFTTSGTLSDYSGMKDHMFATLKVEKG